MSETAREIDILARATAEYGAGRIEAAAEIVASVGQESIRSPALLELIGAIELARGSALAAVGRLEAAVAATRESLGIEVPSLYISLATAAEKAGLAQKAVEAACAARRLTVERWRGVKVSVARLGRAPDLIQIDSQVARISWEIGQYDASISAMARLIDESPDASASLDRAAEMLAWRMRLVEGLVVCLQRHALRPQDGSVARNIAQYLEHLGSGVAAAAWYRRALSYDGADAVASEGLSRCHAVERDRHWDAPTTELIRSAHAMAAAGDSPRGFVASATALLSQFETPQGCSKEDWPLFARAAAIALLRRALTIEVNQPGVARQLAEALIARGDAAEAESILRGAIKRSPQDAEMHRLVGELELANGDDDAAVRSFRAALGLRPADVVLKTRLAAALAYRDPTTEAVDVLHRALLLEPQSADVKGLLGVSLCRLQRLDEGVGWLRQAAEMQPSNATWHFAIACALLLQGKYTEAWPEYAWRWALPEQRGTERKPASPLDAVDTALWQGRTVLLFAEQGQGDTIQMLRYVRMASKLCGKVYLEVQPRLKTLADTIPGVAGVFSQGEAVPPCDVAVPLMHLPWAFGTTVETIPSAVPYLRANLSLAAAFRRRLQGLPGLKVGLVWSGDPRPNSPIQAAMDRRRSIQLADLAPLCRAAGVVFVSLQKGEASRQAQTPPHGMVLHDWTSELQDFGDTAALVAALDLVITVDTAAAHLAGAMGREVWLLNRVDTDWRWLTEREDSPWYPTMRLFRQTTPGDWQEVIERLATALNQRARGASK
jgi:tetratricopeptide (TPR) repeat protein